MTALAPGEAAHGARVVFSLLPALAVLFPALGALAVRLVGDHHERLRNTLAIISTAGALLACAAMFPRVMGDGLVLSVGLPVMLGEFTLAADAMALLFALIASLMWVLATIYAGAYVQHEARRTRYHTFALLTESAALGVFLAADFFVLFVFFELMGMLAYVLVVHNQSPDSRRAGVKYIFMTVYGGLSLLMGVFLFLSSTGDTGFVAALNSRYLMTGACFVASGFMIAGFGVKAGMVPLHVWLPLAHPAAPTPASALLSGVMLKAGAYGMLRVIQTFHAQVYEPASAPLPAGEAVLRSITEAPPFIWNMHLLGAMMVVAALVTMVVGMALAIVQSNVKRLLAYSSISQMGFILLGLGLGAYLGPTGVMGLAGALYHVLNHAVFKSLLFLGIGAVYYRTHQTDMTKLGGLWRKMPLTALFTCIAGLGIMGITLFNGYSSKVLLHHAVVKTSYLVGGWSHVLDTIFIVTAAGTICYISKLLLMVFFGEHRGEDRAAFTAIKDPPRSMLLGMGALAVAVLVLGLFPITVLRVLVIPALGGFAYLDPYQVVQLLDEQFFSLAEMKGMLPPLAIGLSFFALARRFDLFALRLPRALSVDFYYSRAEESFLQILFACARRYRESRLGAHFTRGAQKTMVALSDTLRASSDHWRAEVAAMVVRISAWPGHLSKRAGLIKERVQRWAGALPGVLARREAFVAVRAFVTDISFGAVVIATLIGLLSLALFA